LREWREAVQEIYTLDLRQAKVLPAKAINHPSPAVIAKLLRKSIEKRRVHRLYPDSAKGESDLTTKGNASWRELAMTPLFTSKRCQALATLMQVRQAFLQLGFARASKAGLKRVLEDANGRRAIGVLLRFIKARRVGIDMSEITVCGAVAPYSHLLGGKLVALLMASPIVSKAYERRYSDTPSLIASAMAGRLIRRKPQLVLLGTTSLYGVGASQYNRLRIPRQALSAFANADIQFQELGITEGYGSYHLSQATMLEVQHAGRRGRAGGRRVNSIFGEGVSPKLRKVREALDAASLPSDAILRHGCARIVYGIPLARNFRDVLLGRSRSPRYHLSRKYSHAATAQLAEFWRERWLLRRGANPEIVAAVASNTLTRPIAHKARVPLPQDMAHGVGFEHDS